MWLEQNKITLYLNQTLMHLSAEEQADPVSVLADLCDEYPPGELRHRLNTMQHTALLDEHCNDPGERDAQFFFRRPGPQGPRSLLPHLPRSRADLTRRRWTTGNRQKCANFRTLALYIRRHRPALYN
jgi:hypothetical protein